MAAHNETDEWNTGSLGDMVVFSLYSVYWLPTTCLFIMRRNHEPIKTRGLLSPLIQAGFTMVYFIIVLFQDAGFIDNCLFTYFAIVMLPPFWIYPSFLRAFQLWASYVWNFQKLKHSIQQLKNQHKQNKHQEVQGESGPPTPIEGDPEKRTSRVRESEFLLLGKYRWMANERIQVGIYFGVLAVCIIVALLIFGLHDYPTIVAAEYRSCPDSETMAAAAEVVVAIIVMALAIAFLWKVEDTMWIKMEMKWTFIIGTPLFILWFITWIITSIPTDVPLAFVLLAMFSTHMVIILAPVIVSYKWESNLMSRNKAEKASLMELEDPKGSKSQSLATGKKLDLMGVVMDHPILLASFETYCAKSFSIESVLFLQSVKKFVNDYEADKALAAAKKIRSEFLDVGSYSTINLDDGIIQNIVEAIDENNISRELFWTASCSVHDSLKYGPFAMWRNSPFCAKALKDANLTSLDDLTSMIEVVVK